MPQISVIVPVYKVEPYLHRCVDSILNQTFKDFELILVDDGSPDGCPAICDDYAKRDPRVHVIHQPNGGLSAARNAGIDWAFANSDSEWISFVDSDDWVHQEYLRILYEASQTLHVDICVCGHLATHEKIEDSKLVQVNAEKITAVRMYSRSCIDINVTTAWAKWYRKSQWQNIRFPIGKINEDRFTTHKLIFQNEDVGVIREPLYYYFVANESITRSAWTPKKLDDLEAFKEQFSYFEEHGLTAAWERTAVSHLFVLKQMALDLDTIKPQYSEYRKRIKKELYKALLVYRRKIDLSIKSNPYLYETLFPRTMKMYWLVKAGLNKFNYSK